MLAQKILLGNNLELLPTLEKGSIRLTYIDPPFNTGKTQRRNRNDMSYQDRFDDFESFLIERIKAALPAMTADASLFVHLDYREVHYIKVALDRLLGRDHFMNEIIWSYDYGARSKKKWSCKHDSILWYTMDPKNYVFNYDAIDRVPYMAPDLVGPEKAARGKTLTDVWWNTIVPTNSKEKTGYPTQKPLKILERIVRVHSNPGDTVLDFFAGSGTTGEAAIKQGRGYVLIDQNKDAIDVMEMRLAAYASPSPTLSGKL